MQIFNKFSGGIPSDPIHEGGFTLARALSSALGRSGASRLHDSLRTFGLPSFAPKLNLD